jgi:thioredoxin reductase
LNTSTKVDVNTDLRTAAKVRGEDRTEVFTSLSEFSLRNMLIGYARNERAHRDAAEGSAGIAVANATDDGTQLDTRRAMFDVIIVGGGPAGLSAALVLGRCKRKVVVFDDEQPRNGKARAVHGFLTREGTSPAELRRLGRAELVPYGVEVRADCIVDAAEHHGTFVVSTASDKHYESRKLLIATGVRDRLPELAGLEALLGRSVFQCPYCDGWEVQNQRLAALAQPDGAADFALGLLTWSRDVTLFADGIPPPPAEMATLERHGIQVIKQRVVGLRGEGERLLAVKLVDGTETDCDALFLHLGQYYRSPLLAKFGCLNVASQTVELRDRQSTAVPGLYVAGDAARGVQSVAVAAAEGVTAAQAINEALRRESIK